MGARVTITAAANELDVNKSTISRWCKAHPALRDSDGLVDVAELRAHRDQVLNPKLQTRGAAATDSDAVPTRSNPAPAASLNDARQRTERAKAEMSELDLLERIGRTLDRGDVEAAIAAAAEAIRAEASQAVKDHAERLANIDDARAMEVALREVMDGLMESAARALSQAAAPDDTSHAA
jgi:hypothetical protein